MKNIQLKIKPTSSYLLFYKILYRKKCWFSFLIPWKTLLKNSITIDYYKEHPTCKPNIKQPVSFEKFDDAVEYAKKLKENPQLIDEHNKKELALYNEFKQYNRNKTITL